MIEPFDDRLEVAGTGCFGPIAYPRQGRTGGCSPDPQQSIEPFHLVQCQVEAEPDERLPSRLRTCDQCDPFEHRRHRQHDTRPAQPFDHGRDDGIAAIGGCCHLAGGRKDHPAIGAFEGTQPEPAFDRSAMLAQRRVACGIVGKGFGSAADLRGQHREHRDRWRLAGFDRPAGMAEITELHRIANPVGRTPAPEHLNQIVGAERVQPLDRGGVRWRIEQRGALLWRKDVRDHLDPASPAVTQSCCDDVDAT